MKSKLHSDLETLLFYVNGDGREFRDYLDHIGKDCPEEEEETDRITDKAMQGSGGHIFEVIARLWEYLDGNPSALLPRDYTVERLKPITQKEEAEETALRS